MPHSKEQRRGKEVQHLEVEKLVQVPFEVQAAAIQDIALSSTSATRDMEIELVQLVLRQIFPTGKMAIVSSTPGQIGNFKIQDPLPRPQACFTIDTDSWLSKLLQVPLGENSIGLQDSNAKDKSSRRPQLQNSKVFILQGKSTYSIKPGFHSSSWNCMGSLFVGRGGS